MHSHWWQHFDSLYTVLHNLLPYLIGGGGAAGGQTLLQKFRQRRAAAWPSADGEIQKVEIRSKNGYTVVASYRYYARSEYRYGKYSRHFRRKKQAELFADSLRGQHIQVRFREDKPEDSVVLDQDLHAIRALQLS